MYKISMYLPLGILIFIFLYFILFIILIVFICIAISKCDNFKNTEIAFIHIPKTAGSSIVETIEGKHGQYYEWKRLKNNGIGCSYWHIPPYMLDNENYNNYYKGKIKFLVCRNPYDRIISEYTYQRKNGSILDKDLNEWINFELKNMSDKEIKHDCHLIPQVEYLKLGHGEDNDIIHILYFENLYNDWKEFSEKVGIMYKPLKNKNSSSKENLPELSIENIKLINDFYSEDFIKFNYPKKI